MTVSDIVRNLLQLVADMGTQLLELETAIASEQGVPASQVIDFANQLKALASSMETAATGNLVAASTTTASTHNH